MSEFFIERQVYYHDTDAGGVVYYARYLEHLEEARAGFLRSVGVDVVEYAKKGAIFPIVHLEIDYKSPARYGDTVKIYSRVEKLGNASIRFAHEIKRGDTTLLMAKVVSACVDANLKPRRIPEEIRSALGA